MNPADGLLDRLRAAMIPQPLIVVTDTDGKPSWLPHWDPPSRTIIDVYNLYFRGWIVIEAPLVKILIGDRAVVYERVGFGLHGEWICDLKWEPVPLGRVVSYSEVDEALTREGM